MMHDLPPAKATSPESASDSIVVSFDSRWEDIFLTKSISGFIRKRLPKTHATKYVYFYFGGPSRQISLRGRVREITEISVKDALSLATSLCISKEEISAYCEGTPTIGICKIHKLQKARQPVSLEKLRSRLSFFPPQSFVILALEAKRAIDELAKF
jgi:predicted transcriptional regulator